MLLFIWTLKFVEASSLEIELIQLTSLSSLLESLQAVVNKENLIVEDIQALIAMVKEVSDSGVRDEVEDSNVMKIKDLVPALRKFTNLVVPYSLSFPQSALLLYCWGIQLKKSAYMLLFNQTVDAAIAGYLNVSNSIISTNIINGKMIAMDLGLLSKCVDVLKEIFTDSKQFKILANLEEISSVVHAVSNRNSGKLCEVVSYEYDIPRTKIFLDFWTQKKPTGIKQQFLNQVESHCVNESLNILKIVISGGGIDSNQMNLAKSKLERGEEILKILESN
jgi:hypothetical protein